MFIRHYYYDQHKFESDFFKYYFLWKEPIFFQLLIWLTLINNENDEIIFSLYVNHLLLSNNLSHLEYLSWILYYKQKNYHKLINKLKDCI